MSNSSISDARAFSPECESPQEFVQAQAYAALYRSSTPAAQFLRRRLAHVLSCLRAVPGGRLLDVGCGPGILLNSLDGKRFERHGVDLRLAMIRQAQMLEGEGSMCLSIARLEQLPYPNRAFDVVLALGVLEYLPELRDGLSEIARVAKPDATIIISMLNKQSVYWRWRTNVWDVFERLRSLLIGRTGSLESFTIHSREHLIGHMKDLQMIPRDVVYYDVNVGVEPLASRFPRIVRKVNCLLESMFGSRFSTGLHTAFLVIAVLSP
jgi:2-polyprenyl-3-methyl-5-hydroxy-6-metoxy-1,4-benzoquinol methylase